MLVCTLRAPGVGLALWTWNTEEVLTERGERSTRVLGGKRRGKRVRREEVSHHHQAPSEWPRPVCTVTATFRGFAASEDARGREDRPIQQLQKARAPCIATTPLFRGDSRGIGPQCLLGFLSRESYGFTINVCVWGSHLPFPAVSASSRHLP